MRQLVAELREILADARAVFAPALGVERQQRLERLDRHAAAVEVDVLGLRLVADDRLVRAHLVEAALEDPLEHAQVVAEARPQEAAVVIRAEPVDVEDLRCVRQLLAHVEPVLPVVGHVVAAERAHGHRVAAHNAHGAGRGGRRLGRHRRADEHTVRPVAGLVDQRGGLCAAAAEDDRADRHAGALEEFLADARAVLRRGGEAAVRVRAARAVAAVPHFALPVAQVALGRLLGHALPPDGHVVLVEYHVREDGVLARGRERVRVGTLTRAGGDAEEAVFGVHSPETAVRADAQPGDVVADGPALPAVFAVALGGDEHGEVRLAARRRERARHIAHFAFGVLDAEDEHVLCQPPLAAAEHGGDAQREALFALQHVAAVVGVDGDDLVFLREVDDVAILGIERDLGVHAEDDVVAVAERVEHLRADARHDGHVQHDVDRVRDLDAVLGKRGADHAHGVGDDIHRAAGHGAAQNLVQLGLHLVRIHPVVCGAGLFAGPGADKCPALDTRHVVDVAAIEIAAGQLFFIEFDELAGFHGDLAQGVELGLRAVDPDDLFRGREFGGFPHQLQYGWVLRQFHVVRFSFLTKISRP